MKRLIVAAATCLFAAPAIANDTGFASSHTLRREGGRLCMADHFHGGSGAGGSKVVAYTMAMKGWYDTTAGEYGTAWANWGRSASKKIVYAKTADGWSATVESRPCK